MPTTASIAMATLRGVECRVAWSSSTETRTTKNCAIWYMRMSLACATSKGAMANTTVAANCRRRRRGSSVGASPKANSRMVAPSQNTLTPRNQVTLSWVRAPTPAMSTLNSSDFQYWKPDGHTGMPWARRPWAAARLDSSSCQTGSNLRW